MYWRDIAQPVPRAPSTMTIPPPNLAYQIQTASWRDLGALRTLERECFPIDAWPFLDLMAVLTFPNVVRLKAVWEDQMLGFIAGDRRSTENMAWIATIGVRPAYQRRGIASELLATCETKLDVARVRLSVRVGNLPAIRLYERHGYHRVGLWPEYYQDKSDAIVFEKSM
jgi:ribosomal protein S18 acetylase RimI-like enzyme